MKRFVGLLFLLCLLCSFHNIEAYQIVINLPINAETSYPNHSMRAWNLNTYFVNYINAPVTNPLIIEFDEPGDYALYGNFFAPGQILAGHFYYGDYDELTVISLTDENPIQEIEVDILESSLPMHFKTYDIMDINGHAVIPIFQDFVYSEFTKQLVYENENNEIMLIGYQTYTPQGWETTLLDEELLYIDNNAQAGDSFVSHNYLMWYDGAYLSQSIMKVLGSHEVSFNNNTYTSTAIEMQFDSQMNVDYKYWYEFTGNQAPLLRNVREQGSRATNYDTTYASEFDNSKLLNLTPNIEVVYDNVIDRDYFPKNLNYLDGTFYWYPPSWYTNISNIGDNRQVFYWQHDFNNETIIDSIEIDGIADQFQFDEANILHLNYSFWVKGYLGNGSSTGQTNIVSWPVETDNNDNEIVAFSVLQNNYPNPFNPETTISFNIPTSGNVRLDVYNVRGQKVKTLLNGHQDAGQHNVVWNGRDDNGNSVASGIYLYKMRSGTYSSSKKMILMK